MYKMSDFYSSPNKSISDKDLVYTFSSFILTTTLTNPISKDTIQKSSGEIQTLERYFSLFQRHDKFGYLILRFLESAIFLLRKIKVSLSDDVFETGVNFISSLIGQDVTDENRQRASTFTKLTSYIDNNNNKTFMDDFNDFSPIFLHKYAKQTNRSGQLVWGPIFWAFLHRYVYRLETKLIEFDDTRSSLEINLLQNCFVTLYWFFKSCDELLPCVFCCMNYRMHEFGKELSKMTMSYYPTALFKSLLNTNSSKFTENKFYSLRLLSIHLFVIHHKHNHTIQQTEEHVNYNIDVFLKDMANAQ
jgi:hypothetical protein